MAIKLTARFFGFAVGTIVRDLSYSLEMRLVDSLAASYDLSGGTEQDRPAFSAEMSNAEREAYLASQFSATENWSGWADYTDTTYTDASPQLLTANAENIIEIDGLVNQTQEMPFGLSQFWNAETNAITPNVAGMGILITFETVIKRASGTGRWEFDTFIDIGLPGPVELFPRTIAVDNGSDDKKVTWSTGAYCLDTFVANGGNIIIRPEIAAECHNSRIVLHQLHRGRGSY